MFKVSVFVVDFLCGLIVVKIEEQRKSARKCKGQRKKLIYFAFGRYLLFTLSVYGFNPARLFEEYFDVSFLCVGEKLKIIFTFHKLSRIFFSFISVQSFKANKGKIRAF